jgi:hypothetical protein
MSEIKVRRPRVKKVEAMPVEAMPVQTPAVSPVAETAPAVVAPKTKRVLTPEAREKLLANLALAREAKKAKAVERQKTSSL